MLLPRFLTALLCLSLASLPAAVFAKAGPVTKGAVTVELVAHDSSIQPGRPFWVALKMIHQPLWHSYWINAGTGYPTSLAWKLPEGFTAGPIVWATPHLVKDTSGKVTGNGYEGQVLHFVQITPPASLAEGGTVTLTARAEWLMCKDVCMPGEADLELTLPVKTGKPAPNMAIARLFNNAFHELPRTQSDWQFTAARDGAKITLRLTPAAGRTPPAPTGLHYFDENAVVDYAAPQAVRAEGTGYVIELTAGPDAPANAAGLKGILTGRDLTGPASGYGGIHVDAPFTKAATASSGTAAGAGGSGGSSPSPLPLPPSPQTAAGGLLGTLLLAFLGGLVLNLMPCVFPVLGIKILGFVNQAGHDRTRIAQHGLVFTAGVLLSFWLLAGVLLALRAGTQELGWGFQLQYPAFNFAMAAFLLVFALNLSGLFEVGLSATGVGASLQAKGGLAGSFFTGALAVLVATPCSAPFLAPALGAALAVPPGASLLLFTGIAIGLATPYLLLSIFPDAIRLLPRPGAWMETFKQFMAFPLYATVGWLLWVLAAQTSGRENALLLVVFSFVLIAMAAWLYGRFGQTHDRAGRRWFGRVAALALLVGGLALGWPRTAAEPVATPTADAGAYHVEWREWSPEAVAAAQAAGKFAYVDFTARWCFTCQTNKAAVFSSHAVLAEFARQDVVLFKADWTNRDPQITAELARWNRAAVPFNLIYAPGKLEPVVLPEILTPGRVLEALAAAALGTMVAE